jgi:hypothetical protein
MGGQKISGNLGSSYRDYVVNLVGRGKRGSADLCTYFFLRNASLLGNDRLMGLLATNTISQGDTREVGLGQLLDSGFSIPVAIPSMVWPGKANLQVAIVWIYIGVWGGRSILSGEVVGQIDSYLRDKKKISGAPKKLPSNKNIAFIGSQIQGTGFMLSEGQAALLLKKSSRNEDVIFKFLRGEDFNKIPDLSAQFYVINFYDWPLRREEFGAAWKSMSEDERLACVKDGIVPVDYPYSVAGDYPDCLEIIEREVKPSRSAMDGRNTIATKRAKYWWHYGAAAPSLYKKISSSGLEKVLFHPFTSKYLNFGFVRSDQVFCAPHIVVTSDSFGMFALLQSTIHESWVRSYSSTLENRMRYTPSDCFETFPFPSQISSLDVIGEEYHGTRGRIMADKNIGLTKLSNDINDQENEDIQINAMRNLIMRLDNEVLRLYGWVDIHLRHDFYDTDLGPRFTIIDYAKDEILQRLLILNNEQFAKIANRNKRGE